MNRHRLLWYWRRLGRMSAGEIGHRLSNWLYAQAQRRGFLSAAHPPIVSRSAPPVPLWPQGELSSHAFNIGAYVAAAEKILAGRLTIFNLQDHFVGYPPQWNRDPLTGITAPVRHASTLSTSDRALLGDIKYLWEPNRHLQMVTLAQGWYLTRDPRYLEGIGVWMRSWLEQSPYLMGPNWMSGLEVGIRLINWALVWGLIGGEGSELFAGAAGLDLKERWLKAVYQQAHFIAGHFSGYSSANNHLIGEAAGLYVAMATWPLWPMAGRWQKKAKKILLRQAVAQQTADGVNREQAIYYQLFVLDFLWIAGLTGRRVGDPFPTDWWQILQGMLTYLGAMLDVAGHLPMIGDADDGRVFHLSCQEGFHPVRSQLALGAIFFNNGLFKQKTDGLDDQTRWLLGGGCEALFAAVPAPVVGESWPQSFPHGGYYLLGRDLHSPTEVRLGMDVGTLGYLSIAAHGHADALSLYLSVAGEEILIDPGTFNYHGPLLWRDYFRGTAAHNTLMVDGEDQSVSGGRFMWTAHAQVEGVVWQPGEAQETLRATHTGYRRLSDPVTHQREVLLDKRSGRIQILDQITCQASHHIQRFWHFSATCLVEVLPEGVRVKSHAVSLLLRPRDKNTTIHIFHGDENAPLGWISRRYNQRHPICTIVFADEITGAFLLETEIIIF
ncbi:MAG: heparinase II/III family protein [Magnetococcus sp. DMHC-6]